MIKAIIAIFFLFSLLAAGCAMPKQANDIVLTPLPEGWKEAVLRALAPRAAEDSIPFDSEKVAFPDEPRPCVLTPEDSSGNTVPLTGHCGSLVVFPAGRTRLPPANFMYIYQETGEIVFIRQD